jgi:hypothetical protein
MTLCMSKIVIDYKTLMMFSLIYEIVTYPIVHKQIMDNESLKGKHLGLGFCNYVN